MNFFRSFFVLFIFELCFVEASALTPKKICQIEKNATFVGLVDKKIVYTYRDSDESFYTVFGKTKFGPFERAENIVFSASCKDFAQFVVKNKKQHILTKKGLSEPYEHISFLHFSNDEKKFAYSFKKDGKSFLTDGISTYGPFLADAEYSVTFDYSPNENKIIFAVYEDFPAGAPYHFNSDAKSARLFVDGSEVKGLSSFSSPIVYQQGNHCVYKCSVEGSEESGDDQSYMVIDGKRFGPYDSIDGFANFSADGKNFVFTATVDDENYVVLKDKKIGPFESEILSAGFVPGTNDVYFVSSELFDGIKLHILGETKEKVINLLDDFLEQLGKLDGPDIERFKMLFYFESVVFQIDGSRDFACIFSNDSEKFILWKNKLFGPFHKMNKYDSLENVSVLWAAMWKEKGHFPYVVKNSADGKYHIFIDEKEVAAVESYNFYVNWWFSQNLFAYKNELGLQCIYISGKTYLGSVIDFSSVIYLDDGIVYELKLE
ncbi:hypothetical protein [Treponema zioleckii]|uniref:hypothetical protein n=1 Tax=Treponema zioleckii TaxID=331680 RepID=UPI00168ADFCC|nr:hypothetical protein [Treponema zioleckii]